MAAAYDLVLVAPIGSDPNFKAKWDSVYSLATQHGYSLAPSHDPSNIRSFFAKHEMDRLAQAVLVIIDLSLERPSCYYELALAEASGANTFVCALRGTEVHQSQNRDEIIFYDDLSHLLHILNQKLSNL